MSMLSSDLNCLSVVGVEDYYRKLRPQATDQQRLRMGKLIVAEASVGKGLVMKRFQTRGRGRAAGIVKPFSHLTIVVRERAEAEDK